MTVSMDISTDLRKGGYMLEDIKDFYPGFSVATVIIGEDYEAAGGSGGFYCGRGMWMEDKSIVYGANHSTHALVLHRSEPLDDIEPSD